MNENKNTHKIKIWMEKIRAGQRYYFHEKQNIKILGSYRLRKGVMGGY